MPFEMAGGEIEFFRQNIGWALLVGFTALAVLVVYYISLVRAILGMMRLSVSPVLLTFSFLSLLPMPPTVILGVLVLIIWRFHKRTLQNPA